MKKALITIVSAVHLSFTANAQPYNDSVGLTFTPDWAGPYHVFGVKYCF